MYICAQSYIIYMYIYIYMCACVCTYINININDIMMLEKLNIK